MFRSPVSTVPRPTRNKKGRHTAGLLHFRGKKNYFLPGAIASFAALATRNFTTVFAGILIGSPVCGLRPTRALRFDFTRRPRPGMTNTPFFFVSLIATSANDSRKAAAVLLLTSWLSAMWRTSWVLVIPDAME